MADQKISELTALTGANVADDDAIAIVDTSATETKKIVFSELKNALDTATGFVRITGDTMTGALDVQSTITSDGLTVDGNVIIGDTSNNGRKFRVKGSGDLVELVSTNGGSTGAQLDLKHESASAANGDLVGIINFSGLDGGSQNTQYASIRGVASDISAEKGELRLGVRESSGTYNADAVVIDSSGNLLVGMISANTNNDGAGIRADGLIHGKRADVVATFNRKTTDGAVVEMAKDNAVVGSIGSTGGTGEVYIANNDSVGLKFTNVDAIVPSTHTGGGANRDAAIDLGYSSGGTNVRFKDLYLSGGVFLGGTGSANKLDDYEEGTWTIGVTVGGTAQTVLGPVANYTKIGDTVSIRFRVGFSKSGSGVVNITGLPFASGFGSTVSVPIGCQVNSVTSTAALFANIDSSTTIVHLADQAGDLTDADFASTAYLFGSFTYQA